MRIDSAGAPTRVTCDRWCSGDPRGSKSRSRSLRVYNYTSRAQSPTHVDMEFCDLQEPNRARLVATIGVLSHEPRRALRDAIRATWMAALPPAMSAHFVIRGLKLTNSTTVIEAHQHGDIVFVEARSALRRENGPLASLFLWLQCAIRRHPTAAFVGKADDDVWVSPSDWTHLLQSMHHQVSTALGMDEPLMYVGSLESYFWRPDVDAPYLWTHAPASKSCEERLPVLHNGTVVQPLMRGPFSFAKGALFFVSAQIARAVVSNEAASVEHIVGNDSARCFKDTAPWFEANCCPFAKTRSQKLARKCSHLTRTRGAVMACPRSPAWSTSRSRHDNPCMGGLLSPGPAWEDVWMGHALSRVALGPLVLVHLPKALFFEWVGFKGNRLMITWHAKTPVDKDFRRRVAVLHRWSSEHRCRRTPPLQLGGCSPALPLLALRTGRRTSRDVLRGCGGQPLSLCGVALPNCSSVDYEPLWDHLPPVTVTNRWSSGTLHSFATGRLNVTTEGEMRMREMRRAVT